jgi:hypothetical protein
MIPDRLQAYSSICAVIDAKPLLIRGFLRICESMSEAELAAMDQFLKQPGKLAEAIAFLNRRASSNSLASGAPDSPPLLRKA